ncbi:MAG: polymer-forming cytoskeletal protein [Rhodobacteraceae bacterium]|nr:polymer-forming cytoskeletal protein [Planctomycetales bacterium]MCB2107533.1 polymer-forming cytoskeletal protein [Paracoccaceae bacterium]
MNAARGALKIATLAAALFAAPAIAQEDAKTISMFFGDVRVGGNVRLDGNSGDQVLALGGSVNATGVNSDTFGAAGGQVSVSAVHADRFFAAGGTVTLNTITADEVFAAGGNVSATDVTAGDGHFAGGNVVVLGSFSGDLHANGGNVTVGENATVSGDTVAIGGKVTLSGQFNGDVGVKADEARIAGTINGDLSVDARSLVLEPGTTVAGDMILPAGISFTPPVGVNVSGDIRNAGDMDADGVTVRIALDDEDDGVFSFSPFGSGIFMMLISLAAFGALALGVAPQFMAQSAQQLSLRPLPSLAVGLSSLFLAPLAMALAAATVIGIPFALLGAAAYGVAIALGVVTLCLWGGLALRAATKQPGAETRLARLVGWTLMGFVALALIGAVPILGGVVQLLAVMTGAGAVIATAWAARRPAAA